MEKPIKIEMQGSVPSTINCPSCGALNNIPVQSKDVFINRILLTCSCGKEIYLRIKA